MDIAELRVKKNELEKEIQLLVRRFENETSTKVDNIEMDKKPGEQGTLIKSIVVNVKI